MRNAVCKSRWNQHNERSAVSDAPPVAWLSLPCLSRTQPLWHYPATGTAHDTQGAATREQWQESSLGLGCSGSGLFATDFEEAEIVRDGDLGPALLLLLLVASSLELSVVLCTETVTLPSGLAAPPTLPQEQSFSSISSVTSFRPSPSPSEMHRLHSINTSRCIKRGRAYSQLMEFYESSTPCG